MEGKKIREEIITLVWDKITNTAALGEQRREQDKLRE